VIPVCVKHGSTGFCTYCCKEDGHKMCSSTRPGINDEYAKSIHDGVSRIGALMDKSKKETSGVTVVAGSRCRDCGEDGHIMCSRTKPNTNDEYTKKASKIRPNLLPYEAVIEGIKAMEYGAKKYGPEQWRDVDMERVDFLNALERHLLAYKSGEKLAEDSGVSHLGHIIANCAILLVKFDKAGK